MPEFDLARVFVGAWHGDALAILALGLSYLGTLGLAGLAGWHWAQK